MVRIVLLQYGSFYFFLISLYIGFSCSAAFFITFSSSLNTASFDG